MLISCKQYSKALEILSETSYVHLSMLFLKHCIENKLSIGVENNNEASKSSLDTLAGVLLDSDVKHVSKIARIYLESKSPA